MTPTTSRTSARPAAVASAERVTSRGGAAGRTSTRPRRYTVPPSCRLASTRARDRPGRAAHDRPRAAGAVRLPARRPGASPSPSARGSRCRSAGRTVAGVVTGLADDTDVPSDEARRAAARPAPARSRPTSSASRCGWPRSTARRPPAPSAWSAPPAGARRGRRSWPQRTAPAPEGRLTDTPDARCSSASRPARAPAARSGASHDTLRRLAARGLVTLERRERPRRPALPGRASTAARARARSPTRSPRWPSSSRSGAAAAARRHRLGQDRGLPARRRAGARRRQGVIVLVPEIALTPQTVARFVARFGDTVAVLHSGLGAGERFDEWRRLATGAGADRVGPRSAVFAPVAELGLDRRRRGARRLLQARGRPALRRPPRRRASGPRRAGARLLVGSATPRPESVHALRRVRLPRRVDGRPLPPVEVLDMTRRQGRAASRRTRDALADGGQGDRAAQPPRLVELPLLPLVREGLGVPGVRRGARPAPRRRPPGLPPLRPPRAVPTPLRRLRLGLGRAPRHRHRAPRARARRRASRRRSSASTPASDPAPGARRASAARRAGVLVGTQVVAKGHDFPDVDARRRRRRRPDAALPRLPRRGAHVRARGPARRPGRARAPTAACSCRRSTRPRRRSPTPRATTPTASWPGSSPAARRCAIRRSPR